MNDNARILIFDVPDRRSVPVVGSLGRKYQFDYLIPIRKGFLGQPFVVLLLKIIKPRFSKHIHFIPFNNEDDLAVGLINFMSNHKYEGLLAFSERSTALICKHKAKFPSNVGIPFGSFEDFNRLNDKFSILKIASELHIPTPKHINIEAIEDLDNLKNIEFPIVLKCRKASGVKEALRICNSSDELKKAYGELTSSQTQYSFFPNDKLVAEEFIEGKIYDGCFSVKHGVILASNTQKRDWTIPPSGGFGARIITQNIPELIRYGEMLFDRIKWTGPAQLEFIYDEKQNEYKLIEINPRFWGTIAISIKADMKIAESILESITFGSSHSYRKTTPEGITFDWLLQETYTAERLQGKSWLIVFNHIKRILSKEINNFSYSFGINLLLSLPHILNNPTEKKPNKKMSKSLAKKIVRIIQPKRIMNQKKTINKISKWYSNHSRYILNGFKWFSLFIFLFFAIRFIDLKEAKSALSEISISIFFLYIGILFLSKILYAARWKMINQSLVEKREYSCFIFFTTNLLAEFVTIALPSSIGGEVTRFLKINRRNQDTLITTTGIFIDRLIGITTMAIDSAVVLLLMGQVLTINIREFLPQEHLIPFTLVTLTVGGSIVYFAIRWYRNSIYPKKDQNSVEACQAESP